MACDWTPNKITGMRRWQPCWRRGATESLMVTRGRFGRQRQLERGRVKRQLSDHQPETEARLLGQFGNDLISEARLAFEGLFEISHAESKQAIGLHGFDRGACRPVVEKRQFAEHPSRSNEADDALIISDLPEYGGFPLDKELEMLHVIALNQ